MTLFWVVELLVFVFVLVVVLLIVLFLAISEGIEVLLLGVLFSKVEFLFTVSLDKLFSSVFVVFCAWGGEDVKLFSSFL